MTRRAQVSGRPASGTAVTPHGLHGLRRPRGPPGRAGRGALPPNLPPGLPASLTRPRVAVTRATSSCCSAPAARPGLRGFGGPSARSRGQRGRDCPPGSQRAPGGQQKRVRTPGCRPQAGPAGARCAVAGGAVPSRSGRSGRGRVPRAHSHPRPRPRADGGHLAVRTVPCGSRQPMRRLALDVHVTRFVLFIPSSVQSYFPRVFSVTFRGMSA